MRSIALVSAITFCLVAINAHAQEHAQNGDRAQKMQQRLKAADKDQDGKISKAEADASLPRLAKNFPTIDANNDGFITRDEMRAWREKNGGRRGNK
jgi:Ca2+-binding EF-hand superfamily protein